jgi:MFS family permease
MTTPTMTRRVWDRVATTAVFVANGFAFGVWAGNVARLKEAHQLSDAALGVVLFAISVGAVAPMPITGWLASRLGASRVAAGAGMLLGGAMCLPALLPAGAPLLAGAALFGITIGTMDVSLNGHAVAVERAWGAPIMSSFHAGWSVGGLAGAAFAGVIAGAGAGLLASFALAALLVGATSLLGFTLSDRADQAGGTLAWPSRALLGIAGVAALCFLAEGAVADWSGVYLRSVLDTDAAWAASAYSGYAVAMAVGRLTGDAIVRRLGPTRVVRGGAVLAATGLSITLLAPGVLIADVGMVLVGLGLSNSVPIALSAAGRLRGTTGIAMAASTGYAGFMAGPPIIGATAQAIGLRLALLLVLAAMVAMAALGRAVSPANGSHLADG